MTDPRETGEDPEPKARTEQDRNAPPKGGAPSETVTGLATPMIPDDH